MRQELLHVSFYSGPHLVSLTRVMLPPPYHLTSSALRKFNFLLNKIQKLWAVLVRFFISLLGQRYTMFRDYVFLFSIATYILHCLSATLASIARI